MITADVQRLLKEIAAHFRSENNKSVLTAAKVIAPSEPNVKMAELPKQLKEQNASHAEAERGWKQRFTELEASQQRLQIELQTAK